MRYDFKWLGVLVIKSCWLYMALKLFLFLLTEKRKDRGSSGLHGASGNNWIPPVVLYKDKSGDSLSAGGTVSMTKWLHKNRRVLQIFVSFQSSSTIYLQEPFWLSTGLELIRIPLFLLLTAVMSSSRWTEIVSSRLKCHSNVALDNYRRQELTNFNFQNY
jgi:hypothetical protein